MNRHAQWLVAALTVAGAGWLLAVPGTAGENKEPWQPILPREVYDELVRREFDTITTVLDTAPEDEALSRAKFGAVLVAALTMSVKEKGSAEELRGVREQAILLARALAKKETLPEAKKLLPDLFKRKAAAKMLVIDWTTLITNAELMAHLNFKSKGGDGIHPDLQSNIKLKGALNGIEEKIRSLSMKELSAAGMKKEAKELELMAYRSAVVGALTWIYAPATKIGKKDPDEWRSFSLKMRDHSVDLATAARKADTAAVLKLSSSLSSSCSQCHGVFRAQ